MDTKNLLSVVFVGIFLVAMIIITYWIFPVITNLFGIDKLPAIPITITFVMGYFAPKTISVIIMICENLTELVVLSKVRRIINFKKYRGNVEGLKTLAITSGNKNVRFINFNPSEFFANYDSPERVIQLFIDEGWDITFSD